MAYSKKETVSTKNAVVYDSLGNTFLPNGLRVLGLQTAGFVKTTAEGIFYIDTSGGGGGGGSGTVTSVSVVTANGFAGSVANSSTTPAITISTSITGILKGNGTTVTAATLGVDYLTSVYFQTDYDSAITGVRNSSNKVFTLTTNFVSNTTRVYVNGIRYSPGVSNDYVETGTSQITFTNAPDAGDIIVVDYIKQ